MRKLLKMCELAGIAGVLTLAACVVSAKTINVGYVAAGLQYPFNVAVAKGFQDAAKHAGVNAIVLDAKTSVEKQSNAIDDLIAQKVDGIAVLPLDGIVAQGWVDRTAGIARIPIDDAMWAVVSNGLPDWSQPDAAALEPGDCSLLAAAVPRTPQAQKCQQQSGGAGR